MKSQELRSTTKSEVGPDLPTVLTKRWRQQLSALLAYLLLYMHLDVPRRPRESRHVLTDVLSRNTQTKEGKIGSNTERNYVRAQATTVNALSGPAARERRHTDTHVLYVSTQSSHTSYPVPPCIRLPTNTFILPSSLHSIYSTLFGVRTRRRAQGGCHSTKSCGSCPRCTPCQPWA